MRENSFKAPTSLTSSAARQQWTLPFHRWYFTFSCVVFTLSTLQQGGREGGKEGGGREERREGGRKGRRTEGGKEEGREEGEGREGRREGGGGGLGAVMTFPYIHVP